MGKTKMVIFFCFLHFHQFLSMVESQVPLAPALYIFGDSVVDGGNNNDLNTYAKANYLPYGIDFPISVTGRFTNGLTITDFLDISLGLQVPLPILMADEEMQNRIVLDGFNYASASAGILPETGTHVGENLSMRRQVELFRKTVQEHISLHFKSSEKLSQYMSKCLFAVFIGSNDYANNYLQPENYISSRLYNPKQFAELLATELGNHLKDLYKLGARKFIVFEIAPLGCLPYILDKVRPKTRCAENINRMVSIYNEFLAVELQKMKSTLEGSNFVTAKTYMLTYDMIKLSSRYGLTETRNPCCVVAGNGTGACIPDEIPCRNKNSYLFWDSVHPTEAAYKIVATKCFNGSGFCTPMNILELTQEP